ncbi:MAG: UxaA family hydrolase [Bacilli bacterium]
MKILAYKRHDGTVGIRNRILILPTSVCASDVARIVADRVEGLVSFHNQLGCSQTPDDQKCTINVMAGMAANPNVYGTIAISLGCENCKMELVADAIRKKTSKPLIEFVIQNCGGVIPTIDLATKAAIKMILEASQQERTEVDISDLIIGTECGGSDATSGLAANPLVGRICDKIVAEGGTAILSETTEFIGAENILAKRAVNVELSNKIIEIVDNYELPMKQFGDDVRNRNPSPGNIKGGITTLEEKSLGCIYKSGTTTINNVYDYGEEIKDKGLVIMDTPGNDPISVTGMVAGGCQLVLFTTGRGTPTGNPIVPVIKITANSETYNQMNDCIDFNASEIINDFSRIEEVSNVLFEEIISVSNGKLTKAEKLSCNEIAIARVGHYLSRDNNTIKVKKYYF